MEDLSTFDRLVLNLNSDERKQLLERLEHTVILSPEPLHDELPGVESTDIDIELQKLSLFQRFILFLIVLFTHTERRQVIKRQLLNRLAYQIERRSPGLVAFHRSLLLQPLFSQLARLRDAMAFFQKPLALAMAKERREFIAFLAKIRMEDIHARLEQELDPHLLWDATNMSRDEEVHAEMQNRFDAILDSLSEEARNAMYRDSRTLSGLFALSHQPFETLLAGFRVSGDDAATCDFAKATRPLLGLLDSLQGLDAPPSPEALRGLFLYSYQELLEQEGYDLEGQLKLDLLTAQRCLETIREFNRKVPLPLLCKLITQDLDYEPKAVVGGEDWFALLRDFWKQRLESSYRGFLLHRKKLQISQEAAQFLNLSALPELPAVSLSAAGLEKPMRYILCLRFLKGFHDSIFPGILKSLKTVLLNGKFYKDDNRQDFVNAFNVLTKLNDRIDELGSRLSSGGELAQEMLKLQEGSAKSLQRRKQMETLVERAEGEAASIVRDACSQLHLMNRLLNGILYGKAGDAFDTLSNISALGGVENRQLISSWSTAVEQTDKAYGLLCTFRDLETK